MASNDGSEPVRAADFGDRDYKAASRAVLNDSASSFKLRKRLLEDDARDELEALHDAEVLHALQMKRFAEAAPRGALGRTDGSESVEERGVAALRRLYKVACGHSGQCRYIASFLLGLYNGARFPFDLTDLRAIDDSLFEDCMLVLKMDARLTRREVHAYFEGGGQKWEALGENWRVVDMRLVRIAAKNLAEQVGFSGPHGKAAAELLDLIQGKQGAGDVED